MYYSAKNNEFYGDQRTDTVFIADSVCFALFSQKSGGGDIVPDANGTPVFTPRIIDAPTTQQQRDALQAQIDALESQTHMNRFVREAMLLISVQQATALGVTEPQLYAANIGYKKIKDLDTQIVALRTQKDAIV